ncbi:MAG: substrate-binding domain-containing protein [Bifidobacteriaceae bacterium]|nr:substrate-binding domain-containing protein [Bifidobacteriaceae bacterium]
MQSFASRKHPAASRRTKHLAVVVSGLLAASFALAACGDNSGSKEEPTDSSVGGQDTYTVYLSNNFIANTWRVQMENQIQALASHDEFKDILDLKILNSSANTVSAQTSDLLTAIRAKPDAIIFEASSATALNSTIQMGCDEGILMISFDQTVTAECAYKIQNDWTNEVADAGEWLAAAIGDKGPILVDTGIPGGPSSDEMTQYWLNEFPKKHPDIEIVGTYQSEVNPGVELNQVASQFASHPEVVGVLSEGYCSSIFQASQQAGLEAPVMSCINANVNAIACEENKLKCYMRTNPSWVGALALQQAMDMLMNGTEYDKIRIIEPIAPASVSTAGKEVEFEHMFPYEPLEEGVNWFPDLTPNLILTVTGPGLNLTAEDALKGVE